MFQQSGGKIEGLVQQAPRFLFGENLCEAPTKRPGQRKSVREEEARLAGRPL